MSFAKKLFYVVIASINASSSEARTSAPLNPKHYFVAMK